MTNALACGSLKHASRLILLHHNHVFVSSLDKGIKVETYIQLPTPIQILRHLKAVFYFTLLSIKPYINSSLKPAHHCSLVIYKNSSKIFHARVIFSARTFYLTIIAMQSLFYYRIPPLMKVIITIIRG